MKTVFFDIDTQLDFLFPAGALYVPGAERLLDRFAALNRCAAAQGIPVLSTTDAHTEHDTEFREWPAHCVKGTHGQRKPAATLLDGQVTVPADPAAVDVRGARQIILEKRALDLFSNQNLPAVLEQLGAERAVVYGVVTEFCVRCALLGLLKTGARVELVADAVQELSAAAREETLAAFTASGGVLTSATAVVSTFN